MTSRLSRALAAPALALAALSVGGCAYDGYYGGGSVGYYGDGYGGGYGPYGYGYGAGDYGYGYGWYDGFWYPGSGIYIYDRGGHRRNWRDSDRAYWQGRGGRGGPPPQGWNGGNRQGQHHGGQWQGGGNAQAGSQWQGRSNGQQAGGGALWQGGNRGGAQRGGFAPSMSNGAHGAGAPPGLHAPRRR